MAGIFATVVRDSVASGLAKHVTPADYLLGSLLTPAISRTCRARA